MAMNLWYQLFLTLGILCCAIKCEKCTDGDCADCSETPKVMCYFTNWAWYRSGIGQFFPEDVPTLCTHVLYAFATLNNASLTIQAYDEWADITKNFYTRITALKNKGIIPILSIGGWNDSEGDKYSRLITSPKARKNFIETSIKFLEQYGFVGLDLDWEYPKCWQGDCKAGPNTDKQNFALFVSELRAAYKPKKFSLSAAVPASARLIDAGYDVPKLSCNLDWLNIMAYDYHISTENVTGANSPFFDEKDFGVVQTLQYWVSKGAPKCKLMVGIPFYGHTFTLKNKNDHEIGSPAIGSGIAGQYTGEAGTLSYYEICLKIKNESWYSERTWTDSTYAYKGNQWVSYCDVSDVEDRMWLIKKEGYAGAFMWAVDFDDFKNSCGCGKFPLLTTMARELRGLNVPRVQCY